MQFMFLLLILSFLLSAKQTHQSWTLLSLF